MSTKFHLLENSNIEIHGELSERFNFTHAIFDHDGTLSVLRRGWESVMSEFMFQMITKNECFDMGLAENIRSKIQEFIQRTTGVRTIEQMDGLIKLIQLYQFTPEEEIFDRYTYKRRYLEALMGKVNANIKSINEKKNNASQFLIDGSVYFLNFLHSKLEIYLASGTDEKDVLNEATTLGINTFFKGGIFGARDEFDFDIKPFVMGKISDSIGSENMKNTIVIGDGPVEIREGKKRGAFTIGVASDEWNCKGINLEKRERLISAGAHIIIGDFSEADRIFKILHLK